MELGWDNNGKEMINAKDLDGNKKENVLGFWLMVEFCLCGKKRLTSIMGYYRFIG